MANEQTKQILIQLQDIINNDKEINKHLNLIEIHVDHITRHQQHVITLQNVNKTIVERIQKIQKDVNANELIKYNKPEPKNEPCSKKRTRNFIKEKENENTNEPCAKKRKLK